MIEEIDRCRARAQAAEALLQRALDLDLAGDDQTDQELIDWRTSVHTHLETFAS